MEDNGSGMNGDDLILAIADKLIEEAMAGLVASDCWVDTLIECTRRLRRTYHQHPAAASLSACASSLSIPALPPLPTA